jgi:O-antigen/teichoic acid export membrane protein
LRDISGIGAASMTQLSSPRSHEALMRHFHVAPHVLVAASGWASRVVTAIVQLVAVRILLQNLGLDGYAVFALLTGLQGWFLLADFGFGVSVQNHVSEVRAAEAPSAPVLLAGRMIALALLVPTIAVLYVAAPWIAATLLRPFPFLGQAAKADLIFLSGALSIGFGIGSIVYKVWYAEQRGYLANMLPAAASLLGLAGVWSVGWLPTEFRLTASLAAFVGPTALLPLVVLSRQACKGLNKAALNRPTRALLFDLSRRAAAFWAFAVMAAITLQVDYIVLSQFLGPADIALYTLTTKVYGLSFFFYSVLLVALWPVFAELLARRQVDEARAQVNRYICLGIGYMVVCTFAMLWLMPEAVHLLAPGHSLLPSAALILGMGAYYLMRIWCDTFATVLQSMSRLRPFWLLVPAQALLSVGLQWVLAPRFGLLGVVTGLTLSFALTVAWALPVATRHAFTRLSNGRQ